MKALQIFIAPKVYFLFSTYFPPVVEPFTAVGLLGPEGTIGNYPEEVVVGEPVKLYVFLFNHEGRSNYYVVMVKVGNESTSISEDAPSNATVVKVLEAILPPGST